MIAPTIGAWILSFAQWRFIYGLLAVVGAVQLSIVYFGFVESAKLNKSPLTLKALASDYLRVVKQAAEEGTEVFALGLMMTGCIEMALAGRRLGRA